MATITLPKGSIMLWGGKDDVSLTRVTEHNRAPVDVSWESIETSERMINGTLRKWLVTRKRTWSTSWEMVPHSTNRTVDGGMGGEAMESFYESKPAEFAMEIRKPDGEYERVTVMFNSFSRTVEKRGAYEFWNIDVSIEEV